MELLVQNLCKRFGDKAVLEDINFSMQSGEFVTFAGRNRCGAAITRYLAPTVAVNLKGSGAAAGTHR